MVVTVTGLAPVRSARRRQPRLASIRPGSPAPTTGPGTAFTEAENVAVLLLMLPKTKDPRSVGKVGGETQNAGS